MHDDTLIHAPRRCWNAEVVSGQNTAGQEVIIKRIPVAVRSPWVQRLQRWRLKREAALLRRVAAATTGIVPHVYDTTPVAIVMERLTGPTFHACADELPKRPELFDALDSALRALHAADFAHGELRLGNVMRHDDHVRLIDLTTACSKGSLLFRFSRVMDVFSLAWIKEHAFGLPLADPDVEFRKLHPQMYRFFLKSHYSRDIRYS